MKRRVPVIVVFAVWFGLVTGFGEVILLGLKKFYLGRPIWFGPDIVWMAPLADAILFAACGAVLALLVARRPQSTSSWIAALVLSFLMFLSWLLMYYPIHLIAKLVLAAGLAMQSARVIATQR